MLLLAMVMTILPIATTAKQWNGNKIKSAADLSLFVPHNHLG
jgi:hypothetical protein